MEDDPFDLIPHEEWYETAIRFGLYVGAAFQLCCILAIVVFPASSSDQSDEAHSAKVTHDRVNFLALSPSGNSVLARQRPLVPCYVFGQLAFKANFCCSC